MDVLPDHQGRLFFVAAGLDDDLRHSFQTAPNNGWSAWGSFAVRRTQEPVLGRNADGRLEVFVRGRDHNLWHLWQTEAGSVSWSPARHLSAPQSVRGRPAVVRNADGRLEVFVIGLESALWHNSQTASNDWTGWVSRGGTLTSSPVAVLNQTGSVEVFAVGTDSALWSIARARPRGWSGWTRWEGFAPVMGAPGVSLDRHDRLHAFVRGTDCRLRWGRRGTGTEVRPRPLGTAGIESHPVVATNKDGRLEVFARGAAQAFTEGGGAAAIVHLWQDGTGTEAGWKGSPFSVGPEWDALDWDSDWISGPAVGSNADGRLEVFAVGTDGAQWHTWQVRPNGQWSDWKHGRRGYDLPPRLAVF